MGKAKRNQTPVVQVGGRAFIYLEYRARQFSLEGSAFLDYQDPIVVALDLETNSESRLLLSLKSTEGLSNSCQSSSKLEHQILRVKLEPFITRRTYHNLTSIHAANAIGMQDRVKSMSNGEHCAGCETCIYKSVDNGVSPSEWNPGIQPRG